MSRSVSRFIPIALLLIITAIFLQARTRGEVFPPRQTLQSFPEQLGSWDGTDVAIDDDALQVLGPGDFLLPAEMGAQRGRNRDVLGKAAVSGKAVGAMALLRLSVVQA